MVVVDREALRHLLSEAPKETIVDSTLTPAGVMLLLYPKDGECCVLLSKRTDEVELHKGEICFPGGRKDDQDKTLLDTALRETYEEMGILPEHVELLGPMGGMSTSSKFLISVFVGAIPYSYQFKPNAREVSEVVEVPISNLINYKRLREIDLAENSDRSDPPTFRYQGHLIFGATARVLERFIGLIASGQDQHKEALWRKRQSKP